MGQLVAVNDRDDVFARECACNAISGRLGRPDAIEEPGELTWSTTRKLHEDVCSAAALAKPTRHDNFGALRAAVEHREGHRYREARCSLRPAAAVDDREGSMIDHRDRRLIGVQQRKRGAATVFPDLTGKRRKILPAVDRGKHRKPTER